MTDREVVTSVIRLTSEIFMIPGATQECLGREGTWLFLQLWKDLERLSSWTMWTKDKALQSLYMYRYIYIKKKNISRVFPRWAKVYLAGVTKSCHYCNLFIFQVVSPWKCCCPTCRGKLPSPSDVRAVSYVTRRLLFPPTFHPGVVMQSRLTLVRFFVTFWLAHPELDFRVQVFMQVNVAPFCVGLVGRSSWKKQQTTVTLLTEYRLTCSARLWSM